MFCPYCGQKNEDTVRFCGRCGAPAPVREPVEETPVKKKPVKEKPVKEKRAKAKPAKGKRTGFKVLIILIVVIAAAAGALLAALRFFPVSDPAPEETPTVEAARTEEEQTPPQPEEPQPEEPQPQPEEPGSKSSFQTVLDGKTLLQSYTDTRPIVADPDALSSPHLGLNPYKLKNGVLISRTADFNADGREDLWLAEVKNNQLIISLYEEDALTPAASCVATILLDLRLSEEDRTDIFLREHNGVPVVFCTRYRARNDVESLSIKAFRFGDSAWENVLNEHYTITKDLPKLFEDPNKKLEAYGLKLQHDSKQTQLNLTAANDLDILATVGQYFTGSSFNEEDAAANPPLEISVTCQ